MIADRGDEILGKLPTFQDCGTDIRVPGMHDLLQSRLAVAQHRFILHAGQHIQLADIVQQACQARLVRID